MARTYYSVTSKTVAYIGYWCSSCEYPMIKRVEVTGKGVGETEREAEEKAKKTQLLYYRIFVSSLRK